MSQFGSCPRPRFYHSAVVVMGSGRHAARRTARRRGKTRLRDERMRPGQVRDLAGVLPCDVFSRLSRAPRRSQGSLPQHVSHCPRPVSEWCTSGSALTCRRARSERRACERRDTRQRGKTGSERDGRAAHGAARVAKALWRAGFSTASNGAPVQNAPCGTLAGHLFLTQGGERLDAGRTSGRQVRSQARHEADERERRGIGRRVERRNAEQQ